MCCPTNYKTKWSIAMFKYVIQWKLMFSWAVLIKIAKLLNTLPSKEDCLSQNMQHASPSHTYEIIKKTSLNFANFIKECTAFNIDIITFKPSKDSTSINKDKLDLAKDIMGASNVIFMKRLWYFRQEMLDKTNHRNTSCLNVPQNFIALISTIMVSYTNFAQCNHVHLPNLHYPWMKLNHR